MLQNSTISLIARREILYLLFYAAKVFNTRVEILKPNDGVCVGNSRVWVFINYWLTCCEPNLKQLRN